MAHNFKDLTGQTFGRLTVLELKLLPKRSKWLCKCVCGNSCLVIPYLLKNGRTSSCGCLRNELTTKRLKTHGYRHHPLYNVWSKIKCRCLNPQDKAYKNYGGRGITICDEWKDDPESFIKWALVNGWAKGLEIDREKNNLGYSPDNCRFVTRKINCRNRRSNIQIVVNGQTYKSHEFYKISNNSKNVILGRLRRGWTTEAAISVPVITKFLLQSRTAKVNA